MDDPNDFAISEVSPASRADAAQRFSNVNTDAIAAGQAESMASVSQAARLTAQALAPPDLRSAKIAALKSAIAHRTYRVDASLIAEALIASGDVEV